MARFVYYNINPDGDKESDCVTRAISLCSNLPYPTVRKKLFHTARLFNCDKLCKFCYSNFIRSVLQYKEVNCHNQTVNQFADLHPDGTYLIRVPNHLTCVIRGCVYDIWDCRHEVCDTAWKATD